MKAIKIAVAGASAEILETVPIVSGTVGLPVAFSFDEAWTGFQKTAVFRVNGRTIDQIHIAEEGIVPWELLEKPGCRLWIGVYGINEDGTVQMPTVWVDAGAVLPGADPSGDPSAQPSLPVWQQLTEDVEKALDAIMQLQRAMINGEIVPVGKGGDPV